DAVGDPYWSPDGTKLAWVRHSLYLKDLNSGQLRVLIGGDSETAIGDPLWSPNGKEIADVFIHLLPDEYSQLRRVLVVNVEDGNLTVASSDAGGAVARCLAENPAWSPDSNRIAFDLPCGLVSEDTNNAYDVFVKDLTTGAVTLISSRADGTEGDATSYAP